MSSSRVPFPFLTKRSEIHDIGRCLRSCDRAIVLLTKLAETDRKRILERDDHNIENEDVKTACQKGSPLASIAEDVLSLRDVLSKSGTTVKDKGVFCESWTKDAWLSFLLRGQDGSRLLHEVSEAKIALQERERALHVVEGEGDVSSTEDYSDSETDSSSSDNPGEEDR